MEGPSIKARLLRPARLEEAAVAKRGRKRPQRAQPAKTTLFAGGNEAYVRKTAAGRFSN